MGITRGTVTGNSSRWWQIGHNVTVLCRNVSMQTDRKLKSLFSLMSVKVCSFYISLTWSCTFCISHSGKWSWTLHYIGLTYTTIRLNHFKDQLCIRSHPKIIKTTSWTQDPLSNVWRLYLYLFYFLQGAAFLLPCPKNNSWKKIVD